MAIITNIPGNQKLKDSRPIINQNFANLNADKSEKTEIQTGALTYGLATGSGNAYILALTPAITSYTAGQIVSFKANHTNSGPSTININGLGAKTIKKNKDYDLEAGDIKADGVYTIMYDGANFQMISQLGKKTEAKDFKASPQSPPNLTLNVQAGSVSLAGSVVHFAGGNSPSFTVPTTNPRIDLLVLKSDATLEIIAGTEAASPSPPAYPTDKFVICEVFNRPTQTVIKETDDGVNGYILRDVRASILLKTEFGGDGSDGALAISSGTVTLDLGGAAIFERNYTSISITGTGKLAFINPHANGTIIILKSQGDVIITSTAVPAIDASGLGALGGSGGGLGGSSFGAGGAGGAGANGNGGNSGVGGTGSEGTTGHSGIGILINGGGSSGSANLTPKPGGVSQINRLVSGGSVNLDLSSKFGTFYLTPGGGGGGGTGGRDGAGGAGGRGGSVLYIECGASFTCSSTIDASGKAGAAGSGAPFYGGSGGGGGGGMIIILYNKLVSNTGTYKITSDSNGGIGYSLVMQNKFFG